MKNKVHLTIHASLLFYFIDFTFTLSSFNKLSVLIFIYAYACKYSFLEVGYYSKMQTKKKIHFIIHAWLLFTHVFLFY